MTATDELRRMLDERGVEWEGDTDTRFRDSHGLMMQAFPLYGGKELGLGVWSCTPEQAIEATLGRGTCKMEQRGKAPHRWVCSGCNVSSPFYADFPPRYCPSCGRRVLSGDAW